MAHWNIGAFAIDGRYIQDHFPGIGRYTYNLIDALARVAPDERFIVLHNPVLKNTRYDIAALARHPNIELRRVNAPTFSLREQFLLSLLQLRSGPASSIQLFHSPYFVKPYLSRLPSLVTIFDLIPWRLPETMPRARDRFIFRWLIRLTMRTSRRVIVPSLATRDDLALLFGRDKMTIVPLAPDAHFVPPSRAAINAVRQKYNLPAEYVLYLGSNKPHKNLSLLVRTFGGSQIARRATLVIAGHWDARYPQARAIAQETSARIHFIGAVAEADLPAVYGGATLFVFPSAYEGFGLPPLEAMACGAPVACSNIPSLREVVGDAGLFFEQGINQLGAAMEHALNHPGLRDRLRERGLARAAEFSWERTARETLQVYRDVMGEQ